MFSKKTLFDGKPDAGRTINECIPHDVAFMRIFYY